MRADDIVTNAALLENLPTPVVFDHVGHIPQFLGKAHPAFSYLCEMLTAGKAFVKISGVYQDSQLGPPLYRDVYGVACAFAEVAPQQVLWGTDWPHPTPGKFGRPDDTLLLDFMGSALGLERLGTRFWWTIRHGYMDFRLMTAADPKEH